MSEKGKVKKRVSNTLIGLAGEYAVCTELCRRGILALPTPKNNPLFDIAAMHPSTLKSVAIQVKTISPENKQGWKLGKLSLPDPMPENLYVVLVNLEINSPTEYYIWKYEDFHYRVESIFQEYMKRPKRDGGARKDPGFLCFDLKDFSTDDWSHENAWELLGFPTSE